MFYSQFILSKKGPLGTIWIAAHLERKLRKNQVAEINILTSVDSILFPEVPIALRLSGHLLLGVVRIYSRKVNYLFHDCNEAMMKLKTAFHSTSVDLPRDAVQAPFHSITLPDQGDFDDIDFVKGTENTIQFSDEFDQHITSRDQITLEETMPDDVYLSAHMELDDRFTDTFRSSNINHDDQEYLLRRNSPAAPVLEEDVLPPMPMDIDEPVAVTAPSPNLGGNNANEDVPDVERLRSEAAVDDRDSFGFGKGIEQEETGARIPEFVANTPQEGSKLAEDLIQDDRVLPGTPISSIFGPSPAGDDNDLLASAIGATPALVVADSPPAKRRKVTPKKHKQVFDSEIMLKKDDQLSDRLVRVRKRAAHTREELWSLQKVTLGKRFFSQPSVSGLCTSLKEVYEQVFDPKRLKPNPAAPHETPLLINVEQPPPYTEELPHVEMLPHTEELLHTVELPEVANVSKPIEEVVQEDGGNLNNGGEASTAKSCDDRTPGTFCPHDEPTPSLATAIAAAEQHYTGAAAEQHYTGAGDSSFEPSTPLDVQMANAERRSKAAQEGRKLSFERIEEENVEIRNTSAVDSSVLLESTVEEPVYENGGGSDLLANTDGWSVRSRKVAEFFRAKFEELNENGMPQKVSLESVLTGKGKKEAARMFFEVLVLKTNGYVSTEQEGAYMDIQILPHSKLMKTHL